MRHYFLLTNPSTGGKIQFILYWNWMMTVFSLHISATLHLTIFGIWSYNIQSVQYAIVQFVGFLGRIRFTPQDEKVLPMDDIQGIPKDKVKAESLLITEHSSHTSMCINSASLFLAYQSINWWQNSVHILLKLNDDSLFITYISYIVSDNLWYLKL